MLRLNPSKQYQDAKRLKMKVCWDDMSLKQIKIITCYFKTSLKTLNVIQDK